MSRPGIENADPAEAVVGPVDSPKPKSRARRKALLSSVVEDHGSAKLPMSPFVFTGVTGAQRPATSAPKVVRKPQPRTSNLYGRLASRNTNVQTSNPAHSRGVIKKVSPKKRPMSLDMLAEKLSKYQDLNNQLANERAGNAAKYQKMSTKFSQLVFNRKLQTSLQQKNNEELKRRQEQLADELSKSRQEHAKLSQSNQAKEKALEKKNSLLAAKVKESKELTFKLNETQLKIKRTDNRLVNMMAQLQVSQNDSKKELRELKSELATAGEERDTAKTALNRHRKETQAQLKKYEFDLKKYEEHTGWLDSKVEAAKRKEELQRNSCLSLKLKLSDAESFNAKEMEKLKNLLEQEKKERRNLSRKLAEISEESLETTHSKDSLRQSLTMNEREIHTLRGELAAAKQTIENLEQINLDGELTTEELENRSKEMRAGLDKAMTDLNQRNNELDHLQEDMQAATLASQQAQVRIKELSRQIEQLTLEIQQKDETLAENDDEMKRAQAANEEQEDHINQTVLILEEEREEYEASILDYEDNVLTLLTRNEELERKVEVVEDVWRTAHQALAAFNVVLLNSGNQDEGVTTPLSPSHEEPQTEQGFEQAEEREEREQEDEGSEGQDDSENEDKENEEPETKESETKRAAAEEEPGEYEAMVF